MNNKIYTQLKTFLKESGDLVILDGNLQSYFGIESDTIELNFVIPLCPDYSFEVNDNKERVHDFSGLGDDVGIVYNKLIEVAEPFFKFLDKSSIKYKSTFLMADVESSDRLILSKLAIKEDTFISRCEKSIGKVNLDLRKRKINGVCLGMREFFNNHKYNFQSEMQKKEELLESEQFAGFMKKVIQERAHLYAFWFNLGDEKCVSRAYQDGAMYAAFTADTVVSKGIILCADSEILSRCYNIFNSNRNFYVPILYVKGAY